MIRPISVVQAGSVDSNRSKSTSRRKPGGKSANNVLMSSRPRLSSRFYVLDVLKCSNRFALFDVARNMKMILADPQ